MRPGCQDGLDQEILLRRGWGPQGAKHPETAECWPSPPQLRPRVFQSPHSVPRSPLSQPGLGGQGLPIPQVAAHHLSQAVAPEEAAEHDAGLFLVPAEVLAHGGGADRHADTGTVEQACAQQQRPCPYLALGPGEREADVRDSSATSRMPTCPRLVTPGRNRQMLEMTPEVP